MDRTISIASFIAQSIALRNEVFVDPEETAAFLRARLPDSHPRGILWSSVSPVGPADTLQL